MPDTLPSFQRTQYAFAAHIRNPDRHAPPCDVQPKRMAMYRELFLNNVENFIASGFPVLRAVIDDGTWHNLVHDFFAHHRCQTPYLMGVPEEFLDFLKNERVAHPDDPPFLLELAHYEWVELALFLDEGSAPPADPLLTKNVLDHHLFLSPIAWPLAYRFPVHRISPTFLPTDAPSTSTLLAVYRDRDDRVHFMELNPVSYRLLQLIGENRGLAGAEYLNILAREMAHPNPEVIVTHGRPVLAELAERGIIGTAN